MSIRSKLAEIEFQIDSTGLLSLEEQEIVLSHASFSCLVALGKSSPPPKKLPDILSIEPVILVPVASFLEEFGSFGAIKRSQEILQEAQKGSNIFKRIGLVIDRWHGGFYFAQLLEVLRDLLGSLNGNGVFRIVGPSTVDILSVVEARSELTCDFGAVEETLKELASHGINQIEGGSHLAIHRIAANVGMHCSIAQNFDFYGTRQNQYSPHLVKRFLNDFDYILKNPAMLSYLKCWYPWFSFESHDDCSPAGVRSAALRIIGLARILLPKNIEIRTPWSLFGKTISKRALKLGATNLGYAAADKRTSKLLGIPLFTTVKKQISRLAPTKVAQNSKKHKP